MKSVVDDPKMLSTISSVHYTYNYNNDDSATTNNNNIGNAYDLVHDCTAHN